MTTTVYVNTLHTKRNFECQNIVCCVVGRDELYPNAAPNDRYGKWEQTDESAIDDLEHLFNQAGVEYWGFL